MTCIHSISKLENDGQPGGRGGFPVIFCRQYMKKTSSDSIPLVQQFKAKRKNARSLREDPRRKQEEALEAIIKRGGPTSCEVHLHTSSLLAGQHGSGLDPARLIVDSQFRA